MAGSFLGARRLAAHPAQSVADFFARTMRFLSARAGVRVFRLLERTLQPGRPAAVPASLALRRPGHAELAELCRDPELELSRSTVDEALARGDFCLAAFDGGRAAAYCWFAFSALPHLDGVWADFRPEAAWIYKSLVRASHRGRGIASLLYRSADIPCTARRRRVSLICMESHNWPSIHAARAAGYRTAGYAAYVIHGPTLRAWTSDEARHNGVRFFQPADRAA